jgi:hypothetical protein
MIDQIGDNIAAEVLARELPQLPYPAGLEGRPSPPKEA